MIDKATVKAILPKAVKGTWGEILFSKKCNSSSDARRLYQYLKLSLLDVSNWNRHISGLAIQCMLTDANGLPVGRIGRQGDRVKVKLTGWQRFLHKEDWLRIARVEERLQGEMEFFFFTMGPSRNPLADKDDDFFLAASTVTIFIVCEEHTVDLQIHTLDRTVISPIKRVKKPTSSIERIFLNNFYKRQWGKLVNSLLDEGLIQLTNLN